MVAWRCHSSWSSNVTLLNRLTYFRFSYFVIAYAQFKIWIEQIFTFRVNLQSYFRAECGTRYITMALGDAVNVSSPNYPLYYYDNQNCIWYFTKNGNGTFLIEVMDVLLYRHLRSDLLSIGHGADIAQSDTIILSTDHIIPAGTMITTDEEQMWMTFRSNPAYRQKGFEMEWRVISTECKCNMFTVFFLFHIYVHGYLNGEPAFSA